jgi:rhodanese-related sulfurtransferase
MFNPFFMMGPPIDEIGAEKLKEMIDSGRDDFVILDVRTHQEYVGRAGHIKGSILIPLQSLWHNQDQLESYKDKEIIIYCRTGSRSAEACRILNQKGYKTKNMTYGMMMWHRLGYEFEY